MSDQRCFDVMFPRWFNVSLLSGNIPLFSTRYCTQTISKLKKSLRLHTSSLAPRLWEKGGRSDRALRERESSCRYETALQSHSLNIYLFHIFKWFPFQN